MSTLSIGHYRRNQQQRQGAFTIVELIIAVAVLGVIAALTALTVSRAKHYSLLAACASNMRQIGQAGNMYRADHGGLWPPIQFSSGYSDFSLFVPYLEIHDVFRCPASGSEFMGPDSDLMEVDDYIYLSDMSGQFSDNDFNRGHGNTADFDPGNPTTNAILSWIFNRNTFDEYIIYDSSPDHHDGIVNVGFLRDTRVEQRDPFVDGLPDSVVLQELYNGTMGHGELLDSLDIPPGSQVECLYCGGSGQVMNPNSGKLQSDAACGGAGHITY